LTRNIIALQNVLDKFLPFSKGVPAVGRGGICYLTHKGLKPSVDTKYNCFTEFFYNFIFSISLKIFGFHCHFDALIHCPTKNQKRFVFHALYSSICFWLFLITSSTIDFNISKSFFCFKLFSSIIISASHQLLNNSSTTCLEFVDESSLESTKPIILANSFISNFKSFIFFTSSLSFISASKIVVIYEQDFFGFFVMSVNSSKYSLNSLFAVKILASSSLNLYSLRYINLFSIGNFQTELLAFSIKSSSNFIGNRSGSGKYL
jgi:hypothetical protein